MFLSLMRKCESQGPVVVAIKDSIGSTFGGFISEELRFRKEFFGTGESFLYKVQEQVNLKKYNIFVDIDRN
jgi:TLD